MAKKKTPWQKVFARFDVTQTEMARLMGCHRSKISVALSSNDGLIMPRDQVALLKLAKKRGVELPADDVLPS